MKHIRDTKDSESVYILKSDPYPPHHWDGYYTGDKYRFQGEWYACADTNEYKAKKYKNKKVAERSCEALNGKICNYHFEVIEVKKSEAYLWD